MSATGILGYTPGKSYLSVTVENLDKEYKFIYTSAATAVSQIGKVENFTSPPFKITITKVRKTEMCTYLADFIQTYHQQHRSPLQRPVLFSNRAILSPLNADVHVINKRVSESEKEYIPVDTVVDEEDYHNLNLPT
ncbi:hypothetical protein Btru_076329 [Bulinus truncatus]|nr:hypothetical protein Btru_076329 [Bulinus truncatus]